MTRDGAKRERGILKISRSDEEPLINFTSSLVLRTLAGSTHRWSAWRTGHLGVRTISHQASKLRTASLNGLRPARPDVPILWVEICGGERWTFSAINRREARIGSMASGILHALLYLMHVISPAIDMKAGGSLLSSMCPRQMAASCSRLWGLTPVGNAACMEQPPPSLFNGPVCHVGITESLRMGCLPTYLGVFAVFPRFFPLLLC